MVTAAPLIITPEVKADLHRLREAAARRPVDIVAVVRLIDTPRGKRMHMAQMTAQTVTIPGPFVFAVTFSIETGHPAGVCRHLSMSIDREDRVPSPEAVWMVATELGFAGGMEACRVWPEQLEGHGIAVNLVQPLAIVDEVQS